ncbi:MAG: acetylornithine transaminase [Fimbriimonadaceae bacterium]
MREEIEQLDAKHILPTYKRQPGVFVRGKGARIWDSEGKEYLDFLAGIAVDALGHCHPAMVAAMHEQAQTLIHTSNHLLTEPQVRLAEKLCQITGMDRVFFANDGTTAVECALKIAKKHGLSKCPDGHYEFVSLHRSFHGRTLGALAATAQEKYQKSFRPLIPGFRYVTANNELELHAAMNKKTAAVIVEPIQGEGGLTTMSPEYLCSIRELCDTNDALMIVDEVQTGMGRTGFWLAIHRTKIQPDLVVLAKALGSGFPIGACLTRGRTNLILESGEHGSTFGGSALACATAFSVLNTIEGEGLLQNAQERGYELAQGLLAIGDPIIEVRGHGLMRGAILNRPIARDIVRACLDRGLIINATDETTLRFVPPLIISSDEVQECLRVLRAVMGELG